MSSSRTLPGQVKHRQQLFFQPGASPEEPKGWSKILLANFPRGERRPLEDILLELDLQNDDPRKRLLYTVNNAEGRTMAFALCKLLPALKVIWLSYLGSREQWRGYGKLLMTHLVPCLHRQFPLYQILVWDMKSPREPKLLAAELESRRNRQRFYDNLKVTPPTQRPSDSVEFWLRDFENGRPYRAELRWICLDRMAGVDVRYLGHYILTEVYCLPADDELVLRFLASCQA